MNRVILWPPNGQRGIGVVGFRGDIGVKIRCRERGVRRADVCPAADPAGQLFDPTPEARGTLSVVNVLYLALFRRAIARQILLATAEASSMRFDLISHDFGRRKVLDFWPHRRVGS